VSIMQTQIEAPVNANADSSSRRNAWQRLWFTAAKKGWTSLAMVPTDAGIDVAGVADAFVAAGRENEPRTIQVLSSVGADGEAMTAIMANMTAAVGRGELVVIVTDPVQQNGATLAILRVTSAVLLVVKPKTSRIASARSLVASVGKDRVIGSIVVD
jgi:hypothetical protein